MQPSAEQIQQDVRIALAEDVGDGDITAALIHSDTQAEARIISRQPGVLCGSAWVNEVFHQLDDNVVVRWQKQDGDRLAENDTLFILAGSARSLLTGERSALNFLQLLSGTASRCQHYADIVANTGVKLLDTRKTIPGLRLAQKYAVSCGGCYNHRIGLFDAYLIKENHIQACDGIANAVEQARRNSPGKPVEVEVESMAELDQALSAGADRIMLDNFSPAQMREAVAASKGRAELEASGGITESDLRDYAETGVDYISLGTLTKDIQALDLSMRLL